MVSLRFGTSQALTMADLQHAYVVVNFPATTTLLVVNFPATTTTAEFIETIKSLIKWASTIYEKKNLHSQQQVTMAEPQLANLLHL